MKERISKSDLVITTALIPNRPAPVLILKEMVEAMKPGSVIMDLASENGGNCELTKADEIVYHNNVLIDGNTNFPSTMATDASQLFSKNIQAIIEHCHGEDGFKLNKEDEIIDGMLFIENGEIRHQANQRGSIMEVNIINLITIFILAVFVGNEIINKVPPTLHTPLMSGSNAISGIAIVGALLAITMDGTLGTYLGLAALICATINVVGGFLVTDRMLKMFKKKR